MGAVEIQARGTHPVQRCFRQGCFRNSQPRRGGRPGSSKRRGLWEHDLPAALESVVLRRIPAFVDVAVCSPARYCEPDRMGGWNSLLRRLRILAVLGLAAAAIPAQPVDVSGMAKIVLKDAAQRGKVDNSGIVVWLKPAGAALDVRAAGRNSPRAQFEIRQRRKKFEPHLLPVPVGSVVSFPNLDPFFHNVFSLYDGNRFDLGLYEAGGS